MSEPATNSLLEQKGDLAKIDLSVKAEHVITESTSGQGMTILKNLEKESK